MRRKDPSTHPLTPAELNFRQRSLLKRALETNEPWLSIGSYAREFRISHSSARRDLVEMQQWGLLVQECVGGRSVFKPVTDLARRLRNVRL